MESLSLLWGERAEGDEEDWRTEGGGEEGWLVVEVREALFFSPLWVE